MRSFSSALSIGLIPLDRMTEIEAPHTVAVERVPTKHTSCRKGNGVDIEAHP
jgi:hypothetical protein